jgi:hypothetical protein
MHYHRGEVNSITINLCVSDLANSLSHKAGTKPIIEGKLSPLVVAYFHFDVLSNGYVLSEQECDVIFIYQSVMQDVLDVAIIIVEEVGFFKGTE